MPLAELIKFFRKDPYYRLTVYLPVLDLKGFYSSSLRLRVFAQIDENMYLIRKRVVEKKISTVFHDHTILPFQYYTKNVLIDDNTGELPVFSHVRSLNLLFNYIEWFYKEHIREIVQVIGRVILAQNRISQNRLLNTAGALEDLQDKIRSFDLSLSPEKEDGKQLKRLKFNLSSDLTHQKLYRTMVIQKDREARILMEKGIEVFLELKKVFEELVATPLESISSQLKGLYYAKDNNKSFEDILVDRIARISSFCNLINQIIEIERGN
jgi:hypothetical protein